MNTWHGVPGKLLRRGRHWLAGKYREVPLTVADLRNRLTGKDFDSQEAGLNPENIVWIFGSGRSGSTWLRSMMSEMDHHKLWEEPLVGQLFGDFYDRAQPANLSRPDFVMANATRRGWLRSVRGFILEGAKYAQPLLGPNDYLIVKEPNGSLGAPLLMEALPESRMILLIRDPRDVVASALDGARKGGWLYERREGSRWKQKGEADDSPDAFVRRWANVYLRHAGGARRAYEAHKGSKALVRYEELRTNTLKSMKCLYEELQVTVDDKQLVRAVEKHAWTNVPDKKKGEGKFYRKASPGSWQDDLTPHQARMVERITSPLLEEFYA